MPRESKEARRARAVKIFRVLDARMPEAKIELDYTSGLELLVAVMLAAQCTDRRVNLVTPALFARYPRAADLAQAELPELESLIKSVGLFRSKAKNLIATGRALTEGHGGEVPVSRAALEALPGVGRKTAGVVAIHLGAELAFPVDTHVGRLSRRMGFTRQTDPDKVELDLCGCIPQVWWKKGHQLLVWHGRRTCFARTPACETCAVKALCPRIGVKRPRHAT